MKFQHSLKDVNKKLSEEEARWVMEDVAKFREEEKKKHQEKLNKIRINKENLEKQFVFVLSVYIYTYFLEL